MRWLLSLRLQLPCLHPHHFRSFVALSLYHPRNQYRWRLLLERRMRVKQKIYSITAAARLFLSLFPPVSYSLLLAQDVEITIWPPRPLGFYHGRQVQRGPSQLVPKRHSRKLVFADKMSYRSILYIHRHRQRILYRFQFWKIASHHFSNLSFLVCRWGNKIRSPN